MHSPARWAAAAPHNTMSPAVRLQLRSSTQPGPECACREVRKQTCDLITLLEMAEPLSHYYLFMEDDFRCATASGAHGCMPQLSATCLCWLHALIQHTLWPVSTACAQNGVSWPLAVLLTAAWALWCSDMLSCLSCCWGRALQPGNPTMA